MATAIDQVLTTVTNGVSVGSPAGTTAGKSSGALAGPLNMTIWGTPAAGTAKLQVSADSTDGTNGTWVDHPSGAAITANTSIQVNVGTGHFLRVVHTWTLIFWHCSQIQRGT